MQLFKIFVLKLSFLQLYSFYMDKQGLLFICLQDILQLLGQRAEAPWGVYLQIHTQQLLETSLQLLHSAYSRDELYRPVWISMQGLHSTDQTNVCSFPKCISVTYSIRERVVSPEPQ